MKTAILTGAYGVIGSEIARGLLDHHYQVYLVGRNKERLIQLKKILDSDFPSEMIHISSVDLSNKDEISNFADSFTGTLDVLINNAATAPAKRTENKHGIEMQWATNVLGYYWMIRAFEKHLLKTGNSRVVNVASYWAGGMDLADPEFKFRPYNNNAAYRQSKQADRMLSYGLAETYKGQISINACHPGDANSRLSNDLGFGGSESARQAAATPLLVAITDVGVKYSGEYFEHGRRSTCRFKDQKDTIHQLMNVCKSY